MEATLAKLTELLKRHDTRVAYAAAVVLAELAPKEAAVTEALMAALPKADPARRPFLIEALGRIGTPESAAALIPLIRAGGPGAEEALRAVAHAGAGVLKPLVELLKEVSADLRPKLAEAIARTGEAQGFAALLAHMRGDEPRAAQHIAFGIHNALNGLDARGREALLKQLVKALDTKAFATCEPACLAALELLGTLGPPEALPALLPHATMAAPPVVRRAALLAIARLHLSSEKRASLAPRLVPLLSESDFGHAVEPALAALRGAALGAEHRVALHKLVSSPHQPVRDFVMQTLAGQGTAHSLAELLSCVDAPDPGGAQAALEALAQVPQAGGPLTERLLKAKDGETARAIAHALTRQATHIPPRALAELTQGYLALATGKDAGAATGQREADLRRGALLMVLRAAETPALAAAALKEAHRLRAADEPLRAVALLKSIAAVSGWSDAHKLELALAGLAVVSLDVSRTARASDTNLRLLEEVLAAGALKPTALARQLLGDKAVARKALYYVGFHFAERMLAEREFGQEVLKALAANPRTEEGRQAKEKLILEGLAKAGGATRKGLLEARAEALNAAEDLDLRLREEEEAREAAVRKAAKAKAPKTGRKAVAAGGKKKRGR